MKTTLKSLFRQNIFKTGILFIVVCKSVLISAANPLDALDNYNVKWSEPGPSALQSMPIGNGDIGLNVWVEPNGDLLFYIGKTDAWSEDNYGSWGLVKLGRIRVSLSPKPEMTSFSQILKLSTGEIEIKEGNTTFRVWVDANHPVIRVESDSDQPVTMTATLENWRNKPQNGLTADYIYSGQTDQVAWYHRNASGANVNVAKLMFGAIMKGGGLVAKSSTVLESENPQQNHVLSVYPLTMPDALPNAWLTKLKDNVSGIEALNFGQTKLEHRNWWSAFWNRSWIFLRGDALAGSTTQGYILQRFVTACGGRGVYPIKFNGSVFVVDNPEYKDVNGNVSSVSADFRTWGGQYWFQNTRAMYWPRLAAGDFDMMKPLFEMYYKIMESNAVQVKTYYGHEGSYFAETAPFWGGLKYAGPEVPEDWTLHYFTPVLELSMMMLDYYEFTGDTDFALNRMLPVAKAGITFFNQHFQRDSNGKLLLDPDNAIEMYWKVKNPAPDIAGLRAVLTRLVALPESLIDETTRRLWTDFLKEIPELPSKGATANKVLLPYEGDQTAKLRNSENPELYSVYPFRLYGIGKPDLEIAQRTFNARICTFKGCWSQDPVQAAQLGFASIAQSYVTFNLTRKDPQHKFPAFWERANDYAPDQDNGGNGEHGLQQMIMQTDGRKIYLLPAWPQNWEGDFKLNAPFQTTVEGTITGGTIKNLVVTPASRASDVIILSSVKIDRTGWTVSASHNNAGAAKAIDGNSSTRWDTQATQSPGQTFTIRFANKEKVNKLVLDYASSASDGPDSYELYESANGTDWIGPILSGKGGNSTTEISFPTINTQFLRIRQVGTKGLYWSIHELYAYSNPDAASVNSLELISETNSLTVNGSLKIQTKVLPLNAENQNVLWSSEQPDVATVDQYGIVTGHKEGIVTIEAISLDGLLRSKISLTVNAPTSTHQTTKENLFEILPNPARSDLAYKCFLPDYSGNVQIRVYDFKGACVRNIDVESISGIIKGKFNVQDLSAGSYTARVIAGNYSLGKQFLIQ
jgi:uncharacterized protein YjdB